MPFAPTTADDLRSHTPSAPPTPISDTALATWLEALPDWSGESKTGISRTFAFPDFRDAFGFATRVGMLAERRFHHPDLEVSWGSCTVRLITHSASSVTDADLVMAAHVDTLSTPHA